MEVLVCFFMKISLNLPIFNSAHPATPNVLNSSAAQYLSINLLLIDLSDSFYNHATLLSSLFPMRTILLLLILSDVGQLLFARVRFWNCNLVETSVCFQMLIFHLLKIIITSTVRSSYPTRFLHTGMTDPIRIVASLSSHLVLPSFTLKTGCWLFSRHLEETGAVLFLHWSQRCIIQHRYNW